MTDAFIGQHVLIALKIPLGRSVEGVITHVIPETATLTLSNAYFRDSGHTIPVYTINGQDVLDLKFTPNEPPKTTSHSAPTKPTPSDPAIVSFSKSDLPTETGAGPPVPPKPIVKEEESIPKPAPPTQPRQTISQKKPTRQRKHEKKKAAKNDTTGEDPARLKGPFSAMPLDPDSFDRSPWTKTALASEHDSDEQEEILEKLQEYQEKLVHMETKNKQRVDKFRREIDTMIKSTRSSVSGPSWNRVAEPSPAKQFKGKGWRQDPILKAAAPTDSNMKSGKAKKKQKQRKGKENRQDQTGWATEDATDIQELGDFDFEGGLAKFDKRSVFAQLKEEDHIPSEERLVSHNRVARPGTFGGKNLHPTENVLDPLPRSGTAQRSTSRRGSAHKPSISSESSAESDNLVRVSSRISSARVPQKRFPIRTNTSGSNVLKLSRTGTGASGRLEASTHSIRHIASSTSNENISRLTPAASPLIQSTAPYAEKVHLFIDNDAHSICPTITPGVIVAVENLASSDHNLPLALINENAGRSLAEIIISELISRSEKEAKTSFSALFLVGNHRAGARALVAARHLTDRGVSSICCVLGLDRPGHSLNAEVDEQLSRIRIPETASANSSSNRSALIVVANWREVVKFLSHQTDEQDIWIDALLAPTYTYDTLVPDEQVAVVEMVEWANEGKLILSIDTPCGINASTGAKIVTDSDDDILIYSHIIVSMGAPRTGLLNFGRESWEKLTLEGMKPDFDANIYVVDIGINETWKAYGEEHDLTAGTGVDFGLKWFVKVKVEEEEGPSDGAEEGYSNDGGRVW